PKVTRWALYAATLGLVPHLAAIIERWIRIGHGPYLGFFEVASALSIFTVGFFVAMAWRYKKAAPVGIAVMPVVLIMLAAAMLAPKNGLPISAALASYWLVIHVVFSDLAFGSFVASFGLSIAYLLRARSVEGPWAHRLEKLPAQEVVDDLSFKFVSAGFLFWTVMIASGAIWANEAWGRYWGWDPIETWSLVVWLIYAAFLHFRLTLGWKGERTAWLAIVAMPLAMFSLIGIPFLFKSIHAGYITG
ncbi:MAG: cytochrome C biogenesis protein, partial [Actinobacteria bacterium]